MLLSELITPDTGHVRSTDGPLIAQLKQRHAPKSISLWKLSDCNALIKRHLSSNNLHPHFHTWLIEPAAHSCGFSAGNSRCIVIAFIFSSLLSNDKIRLNTTHAIWSAHLICMNAHTIKTTPLYLNPPRNPPPTPHPRYHEDGFPQPQAKERGGGILKPKSQTFLDKLKKWRNKLKFLREGENKQGASAGMNSLRERVSALSQRRSLPDRPRSRCERFTLGTGQAIGFKWFLTVHTRTRS